MPRILTVPSSLRLEFSKDWMATVYALNLPESSLFRDPTKYLYPTICPFKPKSRNSLTKKAMKKKEIAQV